MNEQQKRNEEMIEIDLARLFNAVLQKAWYVVVAAILGACLSFAYTLLAVTPTYESAAMFYVNNSAFSLGEASLSITNGDLVTSRGLVESYLVILNTEDCINEVIDYSDVKRTYSEVKRMLSAEAVNETEIFKVTVTSPDPEEAEDIASAIAYILPKRISNIIEGTSAKIVNTAKIPSRPSSPSYTKNTVIGFAMGLLLSVAVIVFFELGDVTVRDEEDIQQSCKYPILAIVPDMVSSRKRSHYYSSYDKDNPQKKLSTLGGKKQDLSQSAFIGDNINFAAKEAYKLLRTKIQFSFADKNACHVIGMSSAFSGEGKSLSAVNVAYAMSQLNKKVLLIDCDMRRPTIAKKLGIREKPGFSSYLTGQMGADELIQLCGIENNEGAFHVIAAGECPPNPVELLSSENMASVLTSLRKVYDYIIIDLPPVGEVSDAMSVAEQLDGMLLVVRQDLCNRHGLSNAVRQFEFVDTKILGVIYNCKNESKGGYGKRYGYGYGKGYYRKYYKYSNYEHSAEQREK